MVATAAAIALVAGGLGGGLGYVLADRADNNEVSGVNVSLGAPPSEQVQRPPESIAGIAEAVLPSVVSIQAGRATGSGFVIQSAGYILTNNHVVEAAAPGGGDVAVQFQDGKIEKASIVGRSLSYDLAVVKADRTGLKVATLGNSDEIVVGDPAVAVGSPLGLAGTVTSGIVSALNRPVTAGEQGIESFVSAIQTDAAINPGNSGGPLADGAGRVIGVNSSIATLGSGSEGNIGLGFAIPINQASRVAAQLIKDGVATYPILGVRPNPDSPVNGAEVGEVTRGAPAEGAGIEPGDVITAVDGSPVNDARELIVQIRAKAPGREVKIKFERGGDEREVTVRLGAQQEQVN
jgi:putative serine protease PepD